MSISPLGHTPFSRLPRLLQANVAGLGLLALGLVWLLAPAWRADPDLAHGPAVPVLIAILIAESRRGPGRFVAGSIGTSATFFLLLMVGCVGVMAGGLYATALGFDHAMARFLASLGFGALLLSAWLGLSDHRVRFINWGWPAVVAALLCPLASPLPPGTYLKVSLALQGLVTEGVTQALRHAGIAAYREGNVIELARTSVGVSEACSGVRSLISCLTAGLFFSGLWVRRPWRRAWVIVLSPVIGLGMNAVRSLILTLLANRGTDIRGLWHDLTGYSIIAVTTALVAALAWALRSPGSPEQAPEPGRDEPQGALHPLAFGTGLLAVAGFVGAVALMSRPMDARVVPVPDLERLFPRAPEGWTVEDERDLDQFSDVLRTSTLVRRIYSHGEGRDVEHVTLYVAYWKPGQAPVSVVSAHTPDACWPSSGWTVRPGSSAYGPLVVGTRTLPAAEKRVFEHEGYATSVWYWHLYSGRALEHNNVYSVRGLLELALAYGFRRGGDQLFVLVSSNRPWEKVSQEELVKAFFERLGPLGL